MALLYFHLNVTKTPFELNKTDFNFSIIKPNFRYIKTTHGSKTTTGLKEQELCLYQSDDTLILTNGRRYIYICFKENG